MAELRLLVVFTGFATVLLSATSAALCYLILRESRDREFIPAIVFLGAFSVFMFFASLLYMIWAGFGQNMFLGINVITGIPVFLLFAIMMVNASIWQFKENETFDD